MERSVEMVKKGYEGIVVSLGMLAVSLTVIAVLKLLAG
jgi:hypothetical protein